MAGSAGVMLVTRVLRYKGAVTNITLPFRLVVGLVGSTVVDVLQIAVVRTEPAIAGSAVSHFGDFGSRRKMEMRGWDCSLQLMGDLMLGMEKAMRREGLRRPVASDHRQAILSQHPYQ